MIKIVNKVKYLKTNPKELIDINEIVNSEAKERIDKAIKAINKVNVDSPVTVTVQGKADAFNFSINSDDDAIAKKVQDAIDKTIK